MLDDDAELDDEAAGAQVDVDPLLIPPGQPARDWSAAGRARDDAVALGRGVADDLHDRSRRRRLSVQRSVVAITNGSRSTRASFYSARRELKPLFLD